MDTQSIIVICTALSSVVMHLVSIFEKFLRRIRKSKCLGGQVEMVQDSANRKAESPSDIGQHVGDLQGVVKDLNLLFTQLALRLPPEKDEKQV